MAHTMPAWPCSLGRRAGIHSAVLLLLPLQAEVRGAHEASVWAAAWHPAGHLLATGAADFAVKFWCRQVLPLYQLQLAAAASCGAGQSGQRSE